MEYLTPKTISRRIFIEGIGLVSAGLVLGTLGGCEELAEQIRNRPIRRRIRVGSPDVDADIATYKQAVTLMKGLPSSDLRNWSYQAAIHGTAGVGFNKCPHGSEQFFPWHRAYLFYFEKICQKLTGNDKFGLPYWNWNQNPDLNPAFLDTTSVLFSTRTNTSVSTLSQVSTAELAPIFTDTNFYTFWPQIEGTPHNNVHTFVGGIFGGFGSAVDPIFWTHHCMVDYCWYKWNIDMGNNNPNASSWIGVTWNYFIDADGSTASPMTAGITELMPLLSYQYEHSDIGTPVPQKIIRTKAEFNKLEARIKAGADIRFEIKNRALIATKTSISISKPFNGETRANAGAFSAIIDNDDAKETVFASINYVQLPTESDFFVRVFINLPNANTDTTVKDPHYAGSFAFFGTSMPDHAGMDISAHKHVPKFLVNITPTLKRLKQQQLITDQSLLTVQLVAVPFLGKFENPSTELLLDTIELIVTPVIINSKEQ